MSFGGLFCLRTNKKEEREEEREKSFLRNGGILLKDLIASSNGKCNPIRNFSAEELITATNNFDSSHIMQTCTLFPEKWLGGSEYEFLEVTYLMYKGYLDGRPIIVKKFTSENLEEYKPLSQAIRDIVIGTQMSNHNNVLKLLGCCLEFPIPVLVHEYATNGALNDKGGFGADKEFLPWKIRLRIAKQLANALTYLHTALLRPVIHRDLRPSAIFLDHNFVPKLCNFSISITIPPGESHARDDTIIQPTYCDPEYFESGSMNEKSDVYSFGIVLLIFLTGKKATGFVWTTEFHASNEHVTTEIVDPNILREEGGDGQAQQVEAFLALALACIRRKGEERPDMIDVAKELMRIEKSI
ncbi:non-functional pseudokinase ZED1-like [Corylus avellana]|uniref:non-functional pseudokinase ZED1-like n=1 Tax=Corylus avellana TaxID=13451 RepID=UPI00286CACAB|nr:non-functional pseudokinase ZED1-like [Corylus avellana]XP_059448085.1 non-functional pseudokinase ZED1-like [Corylus avellana]XP_059448086.1 non-functional pseudokinase ZED1-like [Corylus avellana]XP_059448484.1 non-functional pseudokinase ZED1-like [Corylus avellana]